MRFEPTSISGVLLIHPDRKGDNRGWFSETYRADLLNEAGVEIEFCQDNMAYSAPAGVVRGLHWQEPPNAQDKLIQVLDGAILDVVVDIRAGSPSFGRHVSVELTAESGVQLLAPRGVAHGYCTLRPNTRVLYKVSSVYTPDSERGLRWDDPALGIQWPVSIQEATLSERDKHWPDFELLETAF